MDPVRNPFAPGAGIPPPELAGREVIIEDARVAIERAMLGRSCRSQMLLGLRGVGKTVLLNRIEEIAKERGHVTSFVEAPEGKDLSDLLVPRISRALRKLSSVEAAKEKTNQAIRALRSFASSFKVAYGDVSIEVDAERGVADAGKIEEDLPDLFLRVGEAAAAASSAWTLLIDEVQYLKSEDLAGLIVALHRCNQKNLPVLVFGAGLPQVAALSGEAKSYAERLFHYPAVGALRPEDARTAVRSPIADEGESIDDDALEQVVSQTQGYPYFLQEWGYQCWNIASGNVITLNDAEAASPAATERLDEGFFKVRFDRLTPKERDYVIAMAQLGGGPYRSSEVAEALGEKPRSLGPCRSQIISKGMIYSPSHGDIAFTVPMFDDYLRRNFSALNTAKGLS